VAEPALRVASEAEAAGLLGELVAIESVNPALPGGGSGEAGVAARVERYSGQLGLEVVRQDVLPGRQNVIVRLGVPQAARTLVLEAHMDTMVLSPMSRQEALVPVVREGRLYGRGACDTKGALAAMLLALRALLPLRESLSCEVLLLGSVDEEVAFEGVRTFAREGVEKLGFATPVPPLAGAVVGEPTRLQPIIAHKGMVRFRLQAHGRAAHTSTPARGENAIYAMLALIDGLRRELEPVLAQRTHPLLSPPTLTVSRIWGGVAVNVVPDSCTVEIDRRLNPGERAEDALHEIDDALARIAARHEPPLRYTRHEPFVVDYALETPPDAAVVRAALSACQLVLEHPVQPQGVPYGTDASKLWVLGGVPSVVLGPGDIAQAHAAGEYVELRQVVQAAEIYARIALGLPADAPPRG
jgi:acetylornithine deacetylase/succinyl-diaminopimelate desuccinylase-like protein